MQAFSYSAPGGRAYLTIRSTNVDPARRFSVSVSDGFGLSADGLRELSQKIAAYADEIDPPAKPKAKKAPKVKKAPEAPAPEEGGE